MLQFWSVIAALFSLVSGGAEDSGFTYTLIGQGQCVDEGGNQYDLIKLEDDFDGKTKNMGIMDDIPLANCEVMCNSLEECIGFDYTVDQPDNSYTYRCSLLFNNDTVESLGLSENAIYYEVSYGEGDGEIMSDNGRNAFHCYRKDDTVESEGDESESEGGESVSETGDPTIVCPNAGKKECRKELKSICKYKRGKCCPRETGCVFEGCSSLMKKLCLGNTACSWHNRSKQCSDAVSTVPACSQKRKKDCLSDSTCQWDNRTKLCSDPIFDCTVLKRGDCVVAAEDNLCWFNIKERKCIEGEKPCSAFSKRNCKVTDKCTWNNPDKTCSDAQDVQ